MHKTTPARQDLSARLHQQLLEGQIGADEPGAVIAVYQDGTLLASACAGLADTEGGADLSPDTMMNVASISKQLAAAAVLIAARAGTVDLDADIRGLVPELQLSGVTLRNCLNHTAGLPDYLAVAYTVGMPEIEIAALDVFLDWLARVDAHEFQPAERQSYSNTGYVLAALALERAVGVPFPRVLAETVLQPLGMTQSFSTTVLGEFSAGMAFSFTRTESGEFERQTMGVGEVEPVRGVNGDGEVITSLNEFGAWHAFLLDGRVLGDDIRQALLTKTVLNDGRETSYGFGIEHETRANTTAYAHSGGMWGFSAYSIADQATGVSVACFSNRGGFRSSEAAWKAMHFATGFGDVAGRWYSTQSFMGAQVEVDADGNLAAQTGLTEDAETARWAGGVKSGTEPMISHGSRRCRRGSRSHRGLGSPTATSESSRWPGIRRESSARIASPRSTERTCSRSAATSSGWSRPAGRPSASSHSACGAASGSAKPRSAGCSSTALAPSGCGSDSAPIRRRYSGRLRSTGRG